MSALQMRNLVGLGLELGETKLFACFGNDDRGPIWLCCSVVENMWHPILPCQS